MMHDALVNRFRDHLAGLSYPEYALNHIHDNEKQNLNLSLWSDSLPPGAIDIALQALPWAIGSYSYAQDPLLITRLARRLGVEARNIIITAGADDALRVASQFCIRRCSKTLIPVPCFGRYVYHAMVQEAQIHYLRFDTYPFELDIKKLREEACKKEIDCLFVGSPNNPTGHALSRDSIKRLLDTVTCSVILDESLLLDGQDGSCAMFVNEYRNLFICGSFSKLYGLPGLRIGYMVANDAYIELLRKLVSPFGVDTLGLEIAKHVVAQDDWLRARVRAIKHSLAVLQSIDNPRLKITHTSAPVALIEYTGIKGALFQELYDQGVSTVAGSEFPGLSKTNAVRVIIKNVSDMLKLKRILKKIS